VAQLKTPDRVSRNRQAGFATPSANAGCYKRDPHSDETPIAAPLLVPLLQFPASETPPAQFQLSTMDNDMLNLDYTIFNSDIKT
jgi:hypothetical protein